jgi:hypothetical protein
MSCGSRAIQAKPEALSSCSEQINGDEGDVSLLRLRISMLNPGLVRGQTTSPAPAREKRNLMRPE